MQKGTIRQINSYVEEIDNTLKLLKEAIKNEDSAGIIQHSKSLKTYSTSIHEVTFNSI